MSNQTAFQRYLVKMHSDNYLNRFSSVFFFLKTNEIETRSYSAKLSLPWSIHSGCVLRTISQLRWLMNKLQHLRFIGLLAYLTFELFHLRWEWRVEMQPEMSEKKWSDEWNEMKMNNNSNKAHANAPQKWSKCNLLSQPSNPHTHTHMAMHLVNATCMVSFVSWFLFSIRFSG